MLYHKTYVKDNQSEWVVFIHGAGGSSSIWFQQIKAFQDNFNLLLVDLRGHGKSKDFFEQYYNNEYNFENISQDVLTVLDSLSIEKAHFVGVSLGTIIIRQIAEMSPERMYSGVLCGAITRLDIRSRVLVQIGNFLKKVIPYMWLYRLFAWIIMPRKRHKKARHLFINEAKKLYQKEFIRWFGLTKRLNPLLRFFKEKDTTVPFLYIMGDQDHMFLPAARTIVQHHAQSTLQIVPNCGHVCNVEKPTIFNRMAIEYLLNKRV
jgi:pimeloyl-ACP methyl ester carboxylesterase